MQDEKLTPAPNWPYLTFVVIAAASGLGFIGGSVTLQVYRQWRAGQAITGGWSWPIVLILDTVCVAAFLGLLAKIHFDIHVVVGDEALIRKGLLGTQSIRWGEVREIRTVQYGLHVEGESTTIVLAPHAFKDPKQFVQQVLETAERNGAVF